MVPAIFETWMSIVILLFFAVKNDGKWGYSDQNLRLAIPYKFQYAKTFKEDIGIVKRKKNGILLIKMANQLININMIIFFILLSNYYLVENENKKDS